MKIPVGISGCLLGDKVRYDGGHQRCSYITKSLGEYFDFLSICPEMDIGLGVPREPIRLVLTDAGETVCVGVAQANNDFTAALKQCAQSRIMSEEKIFAYIFKSASPSCGIGDVKLWQGEAFSRTGTGIYAAELARQLPDLPMCDELQLLDASYCEKFKRDVQSYYQSNLV